MVIKRRLKLLVKNLNGLNKKQMKYFISIMDQKTLELFSEIFLNLVSMYLSSLIFYKIYFFSELQHFKIKRRKIKKII